MDRKEKTEFLLEQMRLLVLVAKGKESAGQKEKAEADWIKVRVGGRKVNESFLKEEGNEVSDPVCCLDMSLTPFSGVEIQILRAHDPICIARKGVS